MNAFRIGICTAAALAAVVLGQGRAEAYSVGIDQFYIHKNGSQYLNDTFSDNAPPPSGQGVFGPGPGVVSYDTLGTWTEAGGRANADSAGGLATTSFLTGNPITLTRATAQSDVNNADLIRGIKSDDVFQVRALFDLTSSIDGIGSYGIRLEDFLGLSTPGNDRSQLAVARNGAGQYSIRFSDVDRTAATETVLDEDTLQSGHDQILLVLTRATTSSGITASYAYVDGGSIDIGNAGALAGLTFTNMDGVSDIFDGENYTRAQFYATEGPAPVVLSEPLPAALFGAAATFVVLRRRAARR